MPHTVSAFAFMVAGGSLGKGQRMATRLAVEAAFGGGFALCSGRRDLAL